MNLPISLANHNWSMIMKKLTLKTETIRKLDQDILELVVGAGKTSGMTCLTIETKILCAGNKPTV